MNIFKKKAIEEEPYKHIESSWVDLTIGDLRKLKLPDDYKIKFDGFHGHCSKHDLRIDHKDKEVSVNG